jgi:purine-nucleoside phosphorylase
MGDCSTSAARVVTAAAEIRRRWDGSATTAVILGTGLGELADDVSAETTLEYREIPGFPCSTALAHRGRLVCGQLAGRPVLMMQGRCHLYEGHPPDDICLPVRVFAALGIKTIVVTNAAGGINPNFAVGDVMLMDDHINLMGFVSGLPADALAPGLASRPGHCVYDRDLAEMAAAIARQANFPLWRGVYVGVPGPSYETRAEYRAFRKLGGDCVGMSTVPEVLTAATCGLRVLGLSTITNVARPDAPKIVTAEQVVHVAAAALPKVRHIVHGALRASLA